MQSNHNLSWVLVNYILRYMWIDCNFFMQKRLKFFYTPQPKLYSPFFIYKFYCFFNCIWERPKKAVICYFALLAFVSLSQPFSQLLTFNSPKFSLLSFGELKITLQIYREKYCINSNIIKVIIWRVPIYSPFIL